MRNATAAAAAAVAAAVAPVKPRLQQLVDRLQLVQPAKSAQSPARAVVEHLQVYGLVYVSGSLVAIALALGSYLLLRQPGDAAASSRRGWAQAGLPGVRDRASQELVDMPAEQWVRRLEAETAKARAQSQQAIAASLDARTLNVQDWRAAPAVAQQTAQTAQASQDMLEGFRRLEALAAAAAQPTAAIQGDMARIEERYASAAAARLGSTPDRLVVSSSTLGNGGFVCSFSAGVGTGLATISAQAPTLDAACAAALALPDDKIVRLANVPVERAAPATGR